MTTLPRSFTLSFVTRTRKHSQGTQHFTKIWLSLTVIADGHHDLRTSQNAEFPPCTLHLYRERWRSPRSPDFTKGGVSTLYTVPVLWERTATTISRLLKDGLSTLHTTPAVVTLFFPVYCTGESVKQRMQNLQYYCRPRKRVVLCVRVNANIFYCFQAY